MQSQSTPFPIVERFPLVGVHNNRAAANTKDQVFINCYPEIITNTVTGNKTAYLNKRAGTSLYSTPSAAAEGRGAFYWERTGSVYSVYGNTVYKDTTSLGTISTSTGKISFTETDGPTIYLFLKTDTTCYLITDAGVFSTITDVDFPVTLAKGAAYLDGYVFVLKTNGEIYNCDLETPSSWSSLNYITAEMWPDISVAIARLNNHVLVFGENSLEFFYDAGNATGSPLSRIDYAASQVGCASGDTIKNLDNNLYFLGKSRLAGYGVYVIDGTQPKKISTENIDRIINGETGYISSTNANIVRSNGHTFYVLDLPYQKRTLVYDCLLNIWHEWTMNISSVEEEFQAVNFVDKAGVAIFQHKTDGKMYNFLTSLYQDNATAIKVKIVTSKIDLDGMKRKRLSGLELIGDYTTSSTIALRYTDDDYTTWSTARTMDLSGRGFLKNLGMFRRRAFELIYTANYSLRLEALELHIDIMEH